MIFHDFNHDCRYAPHTGDPMQVGGSWSDMWYHLHTILHSSHSYLVVPCASYIALCAHDHVKPHLLFIPLLDDQSLICV